MVAARSLCFSDYSLSKQTLRSKARTIAAVMILTGGVSHGVLTSPSPRHGRGPEGFVSAQSVLRFYVHGQKYSQN